MKVKVKGWNSRVPWLWEANHENRSISHMALSGSCLDVLSGDCLLLQGRRASCFRGHRILKQLEVQQIQSALRAQSRRPTG